MSSFELLELFGVSIEDDPDSKTRTIKVEFAPEDGALAAAMRDGERSERDQMLAQSANVLAVLRAVQAPGADTDLYGERFFLPVARQRELISEEQMLHEERQQLADGPDWGLSSLWHE